MRTGGNTQERGRSLLCSLRSPEGLLASCRRRRNAAALAGSVLAAGWLVGCERDRAAQMEAPPRPPAVVGVATATTEDVPVFLDQIGRTVPVQTVSIVPQVGGKVVATHVEHGDYVKKGQLLFEIDPRPFKAELEAARAELAQGNAELALAQMEFRRVSSAIESAAVSQLEYDQKRSAVAMAEARIAAAQARVESAELNVEFSSIHSPLDGKAGVRLVDVGNVVRANEQPMLVIQQMDPIYAEFTVTENDLGTVRNFLRAGGLDLPDAREQGLQVMVDVPRDSARVLGALGMDPAATRPQPGTAATTQQGTAGGRRGSPREGSLSFLDNTVQDETGTVKLRATLPNADRYFWPGQFVNVRLVLTRKSDAVLIPAAARQIGQRGPYVYVVDSENTAHIRQITPGQQIGGALVVDSGVQAGERVIVSGHMGVQPGSKVMVAQDGEAAPPGEVEHASAAGH